MAQYNSYYKTLFGREFVAGQGLPVISTELDSVRTYQFEVHFYGLPLNRVTDGGDLTLAAKQVSNAGMRVEDITVKRLNDTIYYPGQGQAETELQITFDHLYLKQTAPTLWDWFKTVYNPLTGDSTENSRPASDNSPHFKANKLEVVYLDNKKVPYEAIEYYGVYPKSWTPAEVNYSTNDFHTITVNFRYDFMDLKRAR